MRRSCTLKIKHIMRNYIAKKIIPQVQAAERRIAMISGEVEDYRAQLDQMERNYKAQANELNETNDRVNELSGQNSSLNAQKKRLETTVQQMQSDLDSQV